MGTCKTGRPEGFLIDAPWTCSFGFVVSAFHLQSNRINLFAYCRRLSVLVFLLTLVSGIAGIA